ncbi:integrator complex subunit 12-like [Anthonomus grandis grandis]|uniref:integrator complex subunit 12-like n=1 Tax=Anthonomus grandis grandis TaxID=2921223 RepID=UPI002165E9ED|nr:integrator complex subunit 12-like [Anthonomus grandis grandis]XP_050303366.1 integrator complex subunit 12-like [Anthonomus grandis grandis]XP_050303367.1 integrator complex subunit 12-like [Anthonomus grandis grandis]XP_050303368.1 integrator complex subunit 12-like [Anthonomus grandis grandis]
MSATNNDLDAHLIKCIGLLHESRTLKKGDPVPLQYILEEAIFQKTGVVKDYTDFFQSQLPSRESEEPVVPVTIYDDKTNDSDNDLELDLFKDDLSCVICNKMDVGARNRLLECSDCHALYHQECHKPAVIEEDVMDTWTCSNCKSSKKLKSSEKDHGSTKSAKSDSHRHGSSSSSSHKSSSDKYKSSTKSSSGSSKSSTSSPSHSSRSDEKKSKSSRSSSSKHHSSEKRKHD